jgi:glycosyltransferase involved in cell wall biosynthesis
VIGTKRQQNGPLVSVLISTYNRPAYLAEALESLLAQTWPYLQIVLVRDGGKPVRPVVDRFTDSRLTFIDRDQNRGLPYSFNEALAAARGEYICYLGDDDKLYPHHVEQLVTAMEGQDRCQAVYSDLYKAHCRVMPDGRRIVLAKNVEISRDYDRMMMLQFNHVLHVSVMHRKDLLVRAGGYNEKLNVLIDWDLNRKLCFYTDFLHVPVVTGEYYGPVGDCDRISVQRRKDVNDYLRNVLTIRTTRPPKPWDCVQDLSILILAERIDGALDQTVRDLWSHVFYPNQIYAAVPGRQMSEWNPAVPNVVKVEVDEREDMTQRADRMLAVCQGQYTALFPAGLPVEKDEAAWVERSLYPLLNSSQPNAAFELGESSERQWGAVFRTSELRRARERFGHLPLQESIQAAGITVRKPKFEEYPFQFDFILAGAEQVEREGDWLRAAAIYEHLADHFGNTLWMQIRRANALQRAGQCRAAIDLIEKVNQVRPTVSSRLIEGRAWAQRKEYRRAIEAFEKARSILEGSDNRMRKPNQARKRVRMEPTAGEPVLSQQESGPWT